MTVQCPKCDTINRDDALYCETCGARMGILHDPSHHNLRNESARRETEKPPETEPSSPGDESAQRVS